MKSIVLRVTLGILLVGGLPMSALRAEEEVKTLPTLLIKGEVVSVDTNDPAATLLKVKDRYGFETPIFLTPETKIASGESAIPATNLATGTAVEVEYNFDVNTAKRHAVSVKMAAAAAQAAAAPVAAPATPALVEPMLAVEPTPEPVTPEDPAIDVVAPQEEAAPQAP